jgi:hypothetical protein
MRLQRYEHMMKTIAKAHDVSVPISSPDMPPVPRRGENGRETLGILVRGLLGSYLVTDEMRAADETAAEAREDSTLFSFRAQLSFSQEKFDRIENGLRELVDLRNTLVHQFIMQHDFATEEGWRGAHDELLRALSLIGQRFEELWEWAQDLERARQNAQDWFMSDEGQNFLVRGIAPDGTVFWPIAGVVRALREAAAALAVDGWTPMTEAERWISERHPDQQPADYGCASWWHVLQESGLFETRHFEKGGARAEFYREKARSARPA